MTLILKGLRNCHSNYCSKCLCKCIRKCIRKCICKNLSKSLHRSLQHNSLGKCIRIGLRKCDRNPIRNGLCMCRHNRWCNCWRKM